MSAGTEVSLEVRVELLTQLVELLLAHVVEHDYAGDANAMWRRISPEGREVLHAVAAWRGTL